MCVCVSVGGLGFVVCLLLWLELEMFLIIWAVNVLILKAYMMCDVDIWCTFFLIPFSRMFDSIFTPILESEMLMLMKIFFT